MDSTSLVILRSSEKAGTEDGRRAVGRGGGWTVMPAVGASLCRSHSDVMRLELASAITASVSSGISFNILGVLGITGLLSSS